MDAPSFPSDPRLDYKGQTTTEVSAEYGNMPTGAQVFLVNQTSGAIQEDSGALLDSGGSGKVSIEFDPSTVKGAYALVAQDAAGETLTQTVTFYIDT
jgi:hypothetical protein